jgi:hypothetical protein
MADVYVNNWFEFMTAIAVQGDKVILPENGDWDMADVLPYGINGFQILCDEIDGRGTAIKNLLVTKWIEIGPGVTIKNLKMLDWMCSSADPDVDPHPGNNAVFGGGPLEMQNCIFSGILGYNTGFFYDNAITMYNCSVNIETSSVFFLFDGSKQFSSTVGQLYYCRIEIKGNNISRTFPIQDECHFSEILIYAPNVDASAYPLYFYSHNFSGCVLRGNCPLIMYDSAQGTFTGFVSVYDVDMFADTFTPYDPLMFVGCTDEQLKNPVYLREKGFPIVIHDGGDA